MTQPHESNQANLGEPLTNGLTTFMQTVQDLAASHIANAAMYGPLLGEKRMAHIQEQFAREVEHNQIIVMLASKSIMETYAQPAKVSVEGQNEPAGELLGISFSEDEGVYKLLVGSGAYGQLRSVPRGIINVSDAVHFHL